MRIDHQHTKKIAATTTKRYRVAPNVLVRPRSPAGPVANRRDRLAHVGTAISTPHRKIAPMMNEPITDAITAFGAPTRGFRVSSARVDALSNP